MECKFKNNLKSLRTEYNLKQSDLAAKLNVSKSAVSAWEIGRNQPSYEVLLDIADYFKISVDNLLASRENSSL